MLCQAGNVCFSSVKYKVLNPSKITPYHYFKFDSTQPYFMAHCIESLAQPFSIWNSIGDNEIRTPDLPSTSLAGYQLSCPDWMVTKCLLYLLYNFITFLLVHNLENKGMHQFLTFRREQHPNKGTRFYFSLINNYDKVWLTNKNDHRWVQWGSESRICPVFKWMPLKIGWIANCLVICGSKIASILYCYIKCLVISIWMLLWPAIQICNG